MSSWPPTGRAGSVLANVPALIAFLHADLARLRGNAALATDYNGQTLAELGDEDSVMRSFVRWNLAGADWLRGRLGPAERDLAEVLAERRVAGEGFLAIRVCYDLGQVQRAQGNLDAVLATYRHALDIAGNGEAHAAPVARFRNMAGLRRIALHRLMEQHQQLDPFKFLIYAELAGAELGSAE